MLTFLYSRDAIGMARDGRESRALHDFRCGRRHWYRADRRCEKNLKKLGAKGVTQAGIDQKRANQC
jgi:hypothetical protein